MAAALLVSCGGSRGQAGSSSDAKLVSTAVESAAHDNFESLRGKEIAPLSGQGRAMYAVRGLADAPDSAKPREFSCRLMWGPGERWLSCRKFGGRSAEPEATNLVNLIDSALPKSYRFSGCRSQVMNACVWSSSAAGYPTVALLYGNASGNYEYHLNVYAEYASPP